MKLIEEAFKILNKDVKALFAILKSLAGINNRQKIAKGIDPRAIVN